MNLRVQTIYQFAAVIIFSILTISVAAQPLTGTRTVCATGCDFTTVQAAVTALNNNGVGAGGVTINVSAGHTETLTSSIVLTATGTAANPIIFQRTGTGANPLITAYAGTRLANSIDSIDVMWAFVGSDFVTINGINLQEATANTTPTTMMEVGYGFYKASGDNGCNNNTIQNCTITLNRDNITPAAAGPRQNAAGSIAIEFVNAARTSLSTATVVNSVEGASSNNRIWSNTIQNCNFGILLSGFAAPSPHTLADLNNDIGGQLSSTGNSIINFGGGAAATAACGAILITNQWSFNISNNLVNNNTGTGINHPATNRGVFLFNSSPGSSCDIKKNTISISAGTNTGAITWCLDVEMATTGANGNTINIDSNQFLNCNNTSASTVAFTTIWLNTAATNVNVRGNYIYGFRYSGTGVSQGILSQLACGNLNISGNVIDSVILDGANGTGTHQNIGVTVAPSVSLNINNNIITRTTLNTPGTGTKAITGIHFNGSTPINNFIGNLVDNITRNGTTGGTTIGIFQGLGVNGTTTTTIRRNIVSNLSITGTGATSTMYGIQASTGTIIVDSNTVFNIQCLKTSGTSVLYGIYNISSPTNENYSNNLVYNINHLGTGTTYGLYSFTTTGVKVIARNTIYGVSTAGLTIAGVLTTSSVPSIFNNRIYDISSSNNGNPTVSGIIISSTTAGTATVFNNLIGDLRAPAANTTTPTTAPTIRGINITSATATTVIDVAHNTIHLNATSTGTNFGTTAIFHTTSTIATTSNLILRNNIFVNNSGANGTGRAVAYHRSSNVLTNFSDLSNNNLFYAGIPSASRLIYFDGTNSDQTLGAYITRVAPRDTASQTEIVSFLSTVGANANFLRLDPTIATFAEAGSTMTAGIGFDVNNTIRAGNIGYTGTSGTPDIGAWEDNLTPQAINLMVFDSATAVQQTGVVPRGSINNVILGIPINTIKGANALQATSFKLNTAGSTASTDIANAKIFYTGSNPTFNTSTLFGTSASPSGTFYITGSQVLNTGINYFWLTYDIRDTAVASNVVDARLDSILLSGINYAPINGDPIGSRTIEPPLNGLYNVGSGQTFPTLTLALNALNNLGVSGPVTFILKDPLYSNITGETFPLSLTAYSNSSDINTVSIVPDNAIAAVIENTTAVPTIDINGGSNYIIDGRQGGIGGFVSGNNLIIRNTNTTAPAIRFINDADSNRILFTDLRGANTTALGVANAGVVNFGTTTGPNGNDFNTIKFCDIREEGSGFPVAAISSIGSAATVIANNDNNIIDSCNIYNFFSPTVASAGIYVGANNSGWQIRANRFYQTAARTLTAAVTHRSLWITPNTGSLTSAGGFNISDNFIGGNSSSGSGNYELNGTVAHAFNAMDISVGNGTAVTNVSNNTITNFLFTSANTAATAWLGINLANGNTSIENNIIGSTTIPGSITYTSTTTGGGIIGIRTGGGLAHSIRKNTISGIHIGSSAANGFAEFFGINLVGSITMNIDSNIVGGTSFPGSITHITTNNTATGVSRMSGIFATVTATSGHIAVITNNIIANMQSNYSATGTQATSMKGIHVTSTQTGTYTISNNIVEKLYTATQTTGSGLNSAIVGIAVSTTVGTFEVSSNIIRSLHLTGVSTTGAVQNTGLFFSAPNAANNHIFRNFIHSQMVWENNPNAIITGIDAAAGNPRIVNNMIRMGIDTASNPIQIGLTLRGISKNSSNSSIYFNTVFIGGNNVATSSSNTFAFERSGGGTDDVRNNIFTNTRSNASGGAGHYAIQINNNTTLNSNFNLLFADTIGRVGTTSFANISNWKGGSGVDVNSINGAAGFINASGDIISVNLRINSANPTPIEGTGTAVIGAGTDVDFDGQTRNTLTPVDIGADAGNFIAQDLAAPVITYTPLTNTELTTNRTITATITDATGVYTTGLLTPRIYYKKFAAGSTQSAAGTLISGNGLNGTWTFTINNTLLGGVTGDDSIYYFIVAQDSTTANNLGSNPGGAEGIDVNNITTSPNFNAYKIVAVISGVFTVGNGQPFTTLTGAGGIFSYINSSIVGGNITIQITSDIEETGANGLNETVETGPGNYTIRIEPNAATVRSITGSVAGTGLIRLSGADRVRIDGSFGGSGRFLRFMNRTLNGSTLNLLDDADNDTIANCIIEGVNNTVGMLNFQGTSKVGGTGNDSNAVIGCLFRDTLGNITPTGMPNTCMFSQGAISNDFNTFDNNELVNFGFNGVNLSTTSGDFWRITNNKIYQTRTRDVGMTIFQIDGGSGHTINDNSIGGSAPDRSGTAFQTTSSLVAISLSTTVTNTFPITINNNVISNMAISAAGGSPFFGIRVANGNLLISGNTIGGNMMPYDTIKNNFDNGAITINGGSAVIVENNLISNIAYYRAAGDRNAGITITTAAPNPLIIRNNTIHTITGNNTGTTTSSFRVGGIVVTSAPNNITISGNTIRNIQNFNTGTLAYVVSGIMFSSAASSPIITQNRIRNIGAIGTGAGTAAPEVMGIHMIGSSNATVANNQISLGDSAINQTRVYGIFDASAGTNTYAYNSIFINGQTATGANHSTGFLRSTTTSNINFRNNLVYNRRTTSGTGFNYGVSSTSNVGVSGANIQYNMLIVNDTTRIAELPAGIGNSWSALNTFYPGSYNTNWAELTVNVAPQSLFIDTLNGNLGIDITSPNAWYLNGKGIRIPTISGDFANATGVRSTTITNGATDIGSVEFTPTSIPPLAMADKLPASNDSTQYFFGSRMVAKANWGNTGILPSIMDVRYYSGVNPANTIAGSSFMNGYYDIQPTGGVAYTFNLTLMQDSATHRNITSVSNMQIARYSGFDWSRNTNSVALGNSGYVTANGYTQGGIYTLTDLNSNPLPVALISFTATVVSNDVSLNWSTASEINNYGFFIERSYDGKSFEDIGFEKGKENSSAIVKYNSIDINPFGANEVLYYRLRQVDLNGTISYSKVVSVRKSAQTLQSVSVFPNPVVNALNIEYVNIAAGSTTIKIFDVNGREVAHRNVESIAGQNKVVIDETTQLKSGIYLVKIESEGETQVVKLIKQ